MIRREMVSTPDLLYPEKGDEVNCLVMRISRLLKELSGLTADDMGLVRRRSLQVQRLLVSSLVFLTQTVAELADLRDTLINMGREKLSTRQILMLSTGTAIEETLMVDPSIRNQQKKLKQN